MRINFIRHGETRANSEKRYISRTDEPLTEQGKNGLAKVYPDCDIVVCSPMKRCMQTAEIIYPGKKIITDDSFTECDFGRFEGRNYQELDGDADYQRWIDSGGTLPFPEGEDPSAYRDRICTAFTRIMGELSAYDDISFVVHSGNIMAVLDRFAVPHRDYFSLACGNGCGYSCTYEDGVITITGEI